MYFSVPMSCWFKEGQEKMECKYVKSRILGNYVGVRGAPHTAENPRKHLQHHLRVENFSIFRLYTTRLCYSLEQGVFFLSLLLMFMRLGYSYIPVQEQRRREDTNIFEHIFVDSLMRINPDVTKEETIRVLDEISLELDYEDLGRKFHQRLTATSGIKLIDFKNFNNNSFHITAELTAKNGDEEFRPDITVLINGMPLAFIEVKKPHNKEGVIAERSRINARFKNKHFRRFANISQLMVFSNNMEYEDGIVEPVFGAFYATAAYTDLHFNYFREDEDYPVKQKLVTISEEEENALLKDNNLLVIKHSPEFKTNKEPQMPTHRTAKMPYLKQNMATTKNMPASTNA